MNQLIEIKSDKKLEIEKSSFSFNQKIEILVILKLLENNSQVYQILKTINILRNQIAHRFNFDRKLIDKLIAIGIEGTNGENHLPKNDIEKAKAIKFIIPFFSGILTASLT